MPVSLFWVDRQCNIKRIDADIHKKIHMILNIKRSDYSRWARNYRLKTNDRMVISPKDIDIIYNVQQKYFKNLNKLPRDVQKRHVEKMREYALRENERSNRMWWDDFWCGISFASAHRSMIRARKEQSKIILDILKNDNKRLSGNSDIYLKKK